MDNFAALVAQGSPREQWSAVRDFLIEQLADAGPKESPALVKQLAEVLVKLQGMPGEEKSDLDDLAAKRSKRRSSPSSRAARNVERGTGGG